MATKTPEKSGWDVPPKNSNAFRIALFGRRSAGKTCFLTAINMPRIAHSEGLSCNLKPFEKKEHESFRKGWARIQESTQRIESGASPLATPTGDLLAFHLRVGAPGCGISDVEMIDYSGELLDSAESNTLADALMQHLRASDAVVVLAEYPSATSDVGNIPDELNRLGQAFNCLKDSCPKLPVAFVVNKWDRNPLFHENDRTLVEQTRHLLEFLSADPPPFHHTLRDHIRNATGERVREFPVSVFGNSRNEEYEDESGEKRFREVPVMREGQLDSFGLEDAIFWLVNELKKSRRQKRARIFSAAILGVVMAVFCALCFDEIRFRDLNSVIKSPTSTDEEIKTAESKLEPYFDPANPW
ncbi:MAG TPA: hypothetical protein PK648_18670, partial [Verrucomicrobiales bacterium]|nr:hypothetical protein [Verrucomicrobiales bacterium]